MGDASIWTTKEIVRAVIGTGVITAVLSPALTWLADFVRSHTRRKHAKTYLCMRVASILESYAIECAELVDASVAHYGQTQIPTTFSLPDPPAYPQDVDWHSLDADTAYRAMSFLNECEAQAASARYANHFEGNPFEAEEAAKRTGKKAHESANVFREKADLQPPDLGHMLQSLFK